MVIAATLVITFSFLLGVLVSTKVIKHYGTDEKCRKVSKKHRDVVNWLKSELAIAEKVKLTKTLDHRKIKLLKLIIKRLSS